MFKIALHKDDEKVLLFIRDKLNIGSVRINKDMCIYNITDRKGIIYLISILDIHKLNTTKYLDYLDFKKAFLLYTNRAPSENSYKEEKLKNSILELKNKMNTNRIDFFREENTIIITKF